MDKKSTYSSRERVRRTIRRQETDRLAKGELCINDSVVRQELSCDYVGFAERLAFVNALGLDIFTLSPVYSQLAGGLPNPGECIWPDIEQWITGTGLFNFAIVDGAFEVGMRTLGCLEFLTLPGKSPLSLTEFIGKVEKLNMCMFEDLVAKGIDGIILADDIAYRKGLLINPKILKEYFFPSLARQVEEIAGKGIPVFSHSDGNYREVIPDLINIGFQGLHCIDHNCGMDIADLQREFGNKLCLWGHLDLPDTQQARDPAILQDVVVSVRKLALQKGLILGTNSGLFEGIDFTGLKAIYRSVN